MADNEYHTHRTLRLAAVHVFAKLYLMIRVHNKQHYPNEQNCTNLLKFMTIIIVITNNNNIVIIIKQQ